MHRKKRSEENYIRTEKHEIQYGIGIEHFVTCECVCAISRLVRLTGAERCAHTNYLLHFDRSRSFKVTNSCTNQKHIYDFLLAINCDPTSIAHRFRDLALRSPKPAILPHYEPLLKGILRISSSQ